MMNNKKNESIVKIIERVSISSILSIAVNIFSLVLVFIIHLTLTNYLGSDDYGLYYFIASLVMILSILAKGGIDTLLIKCLPKYSIENNPGLIKGLLSNLPVERAAMMGTVCSHYVVQTLGTQEYRFTQQEFTETLNQHFGS